jgi:U32 family peptidase
MECMRAAVGAGADAVYFGLAHGFNARAKAQNVTLDDLAGVLDYLHRHGVKGYVTFNTLVFDSELSVAETSLRGIAAAGADAVIVQDLGVARLCHALAPELPIHASTQMTVSSPEGAALAKELGVVRVILPRELSVKEIRRFRANTDLELECFVHGALCVSYSGQCLTSEAWGHRSANRGQCAQSCRLPYDLVVDGRTAELGLEKYLLSPKDLGAWELIPELTEAGISCFKIEGRYKGADYVAATVEKYRKVVDGLPLDRADVEELSLTYSRGFSPGWLGGDDHQELSHGEHPGHRGVFVGEVTRVQGFRVWVRLTGGAPDVVAGDWMLFDQGRPEEDQPQGGVFSVGALERGVLEIRFGDPGPNLERLRAGDRVWKSHSAALKRKFRRYIDVERKVALDLVVRGAAGQPLRVEATDALGRSASAASEQPLAAATGSALDRAILADKLGAFGSSPFQLRELRLELDGALAISPSVLKTVRRNLVDALVAQPLPQGPHAVQPVQLEALVPAPARRDAPAEAQLVPLCRTLEQVEAALAFGSPELYLDFMELVGLRRAVDLCRAAGARVLLATMRIQKPGEEPVDQRFAAMQPDGILARHLGALQYFRTKSDLPLHGDFSLNCTNVVTGRTLLEMGLATLTPSYDLNAEQLADLAAGLPPERLEVTVHQHLPLYHTEYCLYAHNLSEGRDYTDCGRPCESHRASLRDQKGLEHPVLVDVGCRNTVFNAKAQSAAKHVGAMLGLGIRRFRAELVWETAAETTRILSAYTDLLAGKRDASSVVGAVGALERYGVTSGTLAVMRPTLPVVA